MGSICGAKAPRGLKPALHFTLALLALAVCCQAAVPTPAQHFGYTPGDDYKLADTTGIFA